MKQLSASFVLVFLVFGAGYAQPVPERRPRRDLQLSPIIGLKVEVIHASDTHFQPEGKLGPIYVGEPFDLDLRITAPGAEFVTVQVDTAAYAPQDVLKTDLQPLNPIQRPTIHGFTVDAEGTALVGLGAVIKDLTLTSGTIPLYLVVKEKTGAVETPHHVRAGALPIIGFRPVRLRGTYEIASRLKFEFYVPPSGPTGWVCEGVSGGPSGQFTVGKVKTGSDLAFRIRSGPLGGNCSWTSLQKTRIDYPWKIVAMNFVTTATSQCQAEGSASDLKRDPPQFSVLRQDEIYIGKYPRITLQGLGQPADHFPILHVDLTCGKTLSNDHSVEMRLSDFELLGPEDETIDQAFNGLLRH